VATFKKQLELFLAYFDFEELTTKFTDQLLLK